MDLIEEISKINLHYKQVEEDNQKDKTSQSNEVDKYKENIE